MPIVLGGRRHGGHGAVRGDGAVLQGALRPDLTGCCVPRAARGPDSDCDDARFSSFRFVAMIRIA